MRYIGPAWQGDYIWVVRNHLELDVVRERANFSVDKTTTRMESDEVGMAEHWSEKNHMACEVI